MPWLCHFNAFARQCCTSPLPCCTLLSRTFAMLYIALPRHCSTLRYCAYTSHYPTSHCSTLPLPHFAAPRLSIALLNTTEPRETIPCRCLALHSLNRTVRDCTFALLSMTQLDPAFATLNSAVLCHNRTVLHRALPLLRIALPLLCRTVPCLCCTLLCLALPCQHGALPNHTVASLRRAQPSLCCTSRHQAVLCCAAAVPRRASPRLRQTLLDFTMPLLLNLLPAKSAMTCVPPLPKTFEHTVIKDLSEHFH